MQHLLLLHGAIGAKDQLQELADLLGTKYHIHTINFSGHGDALAGNNDFSIAGFANEVLSYMQQNKISVSAIFGYSMGGYVAMYMARNYPHTVSKIITLATKFHWDEAIAAKEVKMLDAATIEEKVPAFAEQLRQRHGKENWKILLGKTRDLLLQLGINNTLQLSDYSDISAPCLLLLGDKDKMVTKAETIAVQQALPNGDYRELANTHHPIEQVDRAILAGIIEEFLQ
nr:beta-ketoadipate enol-lactone hydrolase [uncultured bacterium]